MGYILHTYKLDSSKKPYLDRFYYVFKVGQKVDVIVPGYGEALHSVQVDEINEDGIYFTSSETQFINNISEVMTFISWKLERW